MKKFIGGILFTGFMYGFGKGMYELGKLNQKKEDRYLFVKTVDDTINLMNKFTSEEKED